MPKPKPKMVRVSLDLPAGVHTTLVEEAERRGVSLREFILQGLGVHRILCDELRDGNDLFVGPNKENLTKIKFCPLLV